MATLKTVAQIAEMFGVTPGGVRYWISKGLPFKVQKVIGLRPRKVIDPADVNEFLQEGIRGGSSEGMD
jgi:hypothetical protein